MGAKDLHRATRDLIVSATPYDCASIPPIYTNEHTFLTHAGRLQYLISEAQ